ncbi:MAG: zinc-ribbon domain-containing protein [Acetatifactor sp.]
MAILNDFSEKLSQVGQTVTQKTKQLAETAKLSSKISDEEKKMKECYVKIGQLYVSKYGTEPDADFDSVITELHECEDNVKKYKDQLKELKGYTVCAKCGADVVAGSAFCNTCGAPMPVVKPVPAAEEDSAEKEEDIFEDDAE